MSAAQWYKCDALWDGRAWIEPAFVGLDADGLITHITSNADDLPAGAATTHLPGWILPGFINAHSHAFQYAMAGLAEHLAPGAADDDFWSWRETMYGLALRISPDELEAVATMLYSEMLRRGYTRVVEFHYLHNAPDGRPYENRGEMAQRLAAAAQQSGIALTLAPMYYHNGDFDAPAQPRQRRFISASLDDYDALLDASAAALSGLPDAVAALGVHSLRAASREEVRDIFGRGAAAHPVHIHVAEQVREIESCKARWGARPVEWLLNNVELNSHCALVHATHMTAAETQGLARSGAAAVLCPSTEGNLGDGFFNLREYAAQEGVWAIGSDSHVGLSPLEELRWLDYGRRMSDRRRNVLCLAGGDDSGEIALRSALEGGIASAGTSGGGLKPGMPFDAVQIDAAEAVLYGLPAAQRLSALVYAGDSGMLKAVFRRGRRVVENGAHIDGERIQTRFHRAVAPMREW